MRKGSQLVQPSQILEELSGCDEGLRLRLSQRSCFCAVQLPWYTRWVKHGRVSQMLFGYFNGF